jgi:hypothetical protein
VIAAFVPNDVIDTYRGLESIEVLPNGYIVTNTGAQLVERLGPLAMVVYERSHAARIAIRSLLARSMERGRPVVGEDVYREGGFHEDDWAEVLHQYDRMLARAREHGAGFVVVHLPAQGPWQERHAYPGRRLAAWAARAGAGFVDVLPAMLAHPHPERLYWPVDGHPSDEGHAVIAEALRDGLASQGAVP